MSAKSFPPGIHVPSLTWFLDNDSQEIDWDVQTAHLEFLVKSGLHGSKLLISPSWTPRQQQLTE